MSRKKKLIITGVALIAVVLLLIVCFLKKAGNSGNDSTYNSTLYDSYAETFGNNNDIITEPLETEAVTAKKADIEFVYDNIIYDQFGKDRGAIRINNCTAIYHDGYGDDDGYYDIFIDYEKAVNASAAYVQVFSIKAYGYDVNGTPIKEYRACSVPHFDEGEIGKKYKYTIDFVDTSVTRIEFIGG